MAWTVFATGVGRNFRDGFFPRVVNYKKDAEALAEEARREGCTDIRIEKGKIVLSYYAVRYGGTTRLTSEKHRNAASACKECYGHVDEGMLTKNLGSDVSQLRVIKWRKSQLDSEEGWVSP